MESAIDLIAINYSNYEPSLIHYYETSHGRAFKRDCAIKPDAIFQDRHYITSREKSQSDESTDDIPE